MLTHFNDILLTLDSGCSAALLHLDKSSTFDTVDHDILLSHVDFYCGIGGKALDWFGSYLLDRTVQLDPHQSSTASLDCGVPQGSFLGPILFSIYLKSLGAIFKCYNVSCGCFPDDIQVYI